MNMPPGWYPAPSGDPSLMRWWDGEEWTGDFAPAQQVTPDGGYGGGRQPYSPVEPSGSRWARRSRKSNRLISSSIGSFSGLVNSLTMVEEFTVILS